MAKRQIINGGFQDATGNPLNGGNLRLRLNTDAVVGPTGPQVCANVVTNLVLGATGSVNATGAYVWPNDQMSPAGTVYVAIATTAAGAQAWKSEFPVTSGTGAFDLNTVVPTY
jgi:hypothetical protein